MTKNGADNTILIDFFKKKIFKAAGEILNIDGY